MRIKIRNLLLILILVLGAILLVSNQILSWSVYAPEIKNQSCALHVKHNSSLKRGVMLEKCEKEQIDENSYYVWIMNPNGKGVRERNEGNQYRVIKENGDWKFLTLKDMESIEKIKLLLQSLESKGK